MEEFIREKIKDKPINKKKIAIKLGVSALSGILFALTACIVFAVFFQLIYKFDESGNIVCVTDDTETEMGMDTETEQKDTENIKSTQKPETPISQTKPDDKYEITIDDYQKIQNQLYAIGTAANKSIVTITSVKNDIGWFNNEFDSVGTSAGVIVSQTDKQIFILADKKSIADANEIKVTFINDDVADARLYQYDNNTGIAILTVNKDVLEDVTLRVIQTIKMANSKMVSKGTTVIAIGNPLGINYSILTGSVTSTEHEVTALDHNYKVFITDMTATTDSGGVLINKDGELVGLILHNEIVKEAHNVISAVGIREVEPVINLLLSGKSVPYIGMEVVTVTDKISKNYDLPKGVYIRNAIVDTPGMLAGMQTGDVITKVNNVEVYSASDYYSEILKLELEKEYTIIVSRQGSKGYYTVNCKVKPGVLK